MFIAQDTLTEYLDSIGCTVEELYAEVRETKDQTHDAYLLLFIDCLVASADYESFYKVMLKEGKKCKALRDGGKTGSGWVSAVDFKADEKGSPSSGSGSGTGVGANVRSPSSSSMTSDVKWADEGKKSDRVDNKDDSFGYK